MDTLLAEFHSQIDELSDLLTLQLMPAPAGPASSPEDLPALLVAHVATLAARVEDLRAAVADEYAAIASAEDLKLKLDVQRAHMEHMLANIPESLPLPEPEPEPQPEVPKPKKKGRGGAENADPNNSGLLARKPRSGLAATARPAKDEKRTVALLTQAEFDGLPRYMLGRLTLEKLNDMVANFNSLLTAKYNLLALPSKSLSKPQRDKVLAYADHEKPETRGRFFITEQELRESAREKFKHDPAGKTVVTILRQVGRVKEVRGGGHNRILVV